MQSDGLLEFESVLSRRDDFREFFDNNNTTLLNNTNNKAAVVRLNFDDTTTDDNVTLHQGDYYYNTSDAAAVDNEQQQQHALSDMSMLARDLNKMSLNTSTLSSGGGTCVCVAFKLLHIYLFPRSLTSIIR
jgi:hypothetical protein